jgi:hypothetical protein
MSGAANALQQANHVARRMHQNSQINRANVDAQLKARAANDRAQSAVFEPFLNLPAALGG